MRDENTINGQVGSRTFFWVPFSHVKEIAFCLQFWVLNISFTSFSMMLNLIALIKYFEGKKDIVKKHTADQDNEDVKIFKVQQNDLF